MTPSPLQIDWASMFPDGPSFLVRAVHPKDGKGTYRVDADSSAWTFLKKLGAGEAFEWPSGISPDGKTVILNRAMTGPGNRGLNRVVVWDIETGQERELMEGSGLSRLSDDGKQLADSRPDGKDLVIDVLAAAGGPRREVYRVPGFQGASIAWTPDGRYLIFGPHNKLGGSKGFMRVSVDVGEAQPIGISASQDGHFQFPRNLGATRVHPNGRQLVYTARGEGGGGSETWALENFLPKPAK